MRSFNYIALAPSRHVVPYIQESVEGCLRPLAAALADNLIIACLNASGTSDKIPVPPPVDEKIQSFEYVLAFRGSGALPAPEKQVAVLQAVNIIGRRWPEEDEVESSASESEEEPLAASTGLGGFSATLATTFGLDALGFGGSAWSATPSAAARKSNQENHVPKNFDEESARGLTNSIEFASGIGPDRMRGVSKDRNQRMHHANSALVDFVGAPMSANGVEEKRPSDWLDLGVPSREMLCAPEQATIYVDNARAMAGGGTTAAALRRGGVVLQVAGGAPNPTVVFRSVQGRSRALTLKPSDSLALRPGDVIELGECVLLLCLTFFYA